MFVFKKILTPFLLPPGIFVIALILCGAWLLYKKNRRMGIVNIIIAVLMWLLSIAPVSNQLLKNLESEFKVPKNPKGDVIILLGGGISDDKLTRLVGAAFLQKRLNLPVIVSAGNSAYHSKKLLVQLGLSSDDIIIEDSSRDTYENAKYSRDICERLGYNDPILVTSAYHLKRSVMSFEKVGLKVLPYPVGFRWVIDLGHRWNLYLPDDYKDTSIAITEHLGLLYYRFAY